MKKIKDTTKGKKHIKRNQTNDMNNTEKKNSLLIIT